MQTNPPPGPELPPTGEVNSKAALTMPSFFSIGPSKADSRISAGSNGLGSGFWRLSDRSTGSMEIPPIAGMPPWSEGLNSKWEENAVFPDAQPNVLQKQNDPILTPVTVAADPVTDPFLQFMKSDAGSGAVELQACVAAGQAGMGKLKSGSRPSSKQSSDSFDFAAEFHNTMTDTHQERALGGRENLSSGTPDLLPSFDNLERNLKQDRVNQPPKTTQMPGVVLPPRLSDLSTIDTDGEEESKENPDGHMSLSRSNSVARSPSPIDNLMNTANSNTTADQSTLSKERLCVVDTANPTRQFVCTDCEKRFRHRHRLELHRRVVHLRHRPHPCEYCNSHFGTTSNLRRHIRMVHDKLKRHFCPECGLGFCEPGDLKKHLKRTNHGAKPSAVSALGVNRADGPTTTSQNPPGPSVPQGDVSSGTFPQLKRDWDILSMN